MSAIYFHHRQNQWRWSIKKKDHKFPDSSTVAAAGRPGQSEAGLHRLYPGATAPFWAYALTHSLPWSLPPPGWLLSFSEGRRTVVSLELILIFTLNFNFRIGATTCTLKLREGGFMARFQQNRPSLQVLRSPHCWFLYTHCLYKAELSPFIIMNCPEQVSVDPDPCRLWRSNPPSWDYSIEFQSHGKIYS